MLLIGVRVLEGSSVVEGSTSQKDTTLTGEFVGAVMVRIGLLRLRCRRSCVGISTRVL